jgi:multiple sugar transport system permease protein
MSTVSTESVTGTGATLVATPPARRRATRQAGNGLTGWLFVSPALLILVVFLLIPIVLAFYVSLTDWTGLTSPFADSVHVVGTDNYRRLLTARGGLTHVNFMTAVRNNFYFVIITVPLQTALALFLAILVNNRRLKGKGFFRTAFYFPSITSSIAISVVFIFLFQGIGPVNAILKLIGVKGPNWIIDTRGVFWQFLRIFGVDHEPGWAKHPFLGLTWYDWLSGPSVGMLVIIIMCVWTTSGTFMLFFLGALQNIAEEVDDSSEVDGATPWQRFRFVTFPMLRPTVALVVTLGVISTWQIFDQIFVFGPNNQSVITPAYMSYQQAFGGSAAFGVGAAIAFLLFILIIGMNALQRRFLKEDLEQ